jgi:hypothetical protein
MIVIDAGLQETIHSCSWSNAQQDTVRTQLEPIHVVINHTANLSSDRRVRRIEEGYVGVQVVLE